MPSQGSEEHIRNALYLQWLKEWEDQARQHNSKGVTVYRRAYHALKACPITFTHPHQLQQLKGFGETLCKRLTHNLEKHCEENGLPMPLKRKLKLPGQPDDDDNGDAEARPAKKPRKTKPYVPAYRSGAYGLVMGLARAGSSGGLTKDKLIEAAQPHCDASYTAPSDPTSFYTAWNSMKTLLQKDVVDERGRPTRKYSLTDEGWEVASRIQQTLNPDAAPLAPLGRSGSAAQVAQSAVSDLMPAERSHSIEVEPSLPPAFAYADVVPDGNTASTELAIPSFRPQSLPPGSFTVHLVLDNREVRAKTDRDYMQIELAKKGVTPIVRPLEVGDALWVAKCHDPNFLRRIGAEGDELVLDWIVERKRLDDLIGSIKDGRFHEQKFRLKRSGVKNVIYIVEEMAIDPSNKERYDEMVRSAMASTQVVNGYFLKQTQKMDDTIRYLTRMTLLLNKQYESKSLLVIPTEVLTARNYLPLLEDLRQKKPETGHYISYDAFASLASKSDMMTLRDVFLKMLMCTKQVTGETAIEIQKRWKTPNEFVKAFDRLGPGAEGNKQKREIVFGEMGNLYGRRKVAKALSHKIAEIWGDA